MQSKRRMMGFRASLADRIVDAILAGRLPPGARLDEGVLAAEADPATIREALADVIARGLARHHPEGGVEVTPLDPAILLEWFEALGEIQAKCAMLAARRAPGVDLLPLEDLVAQMEDAEFETYRQLAFELHDRICRMAKNREMARIAAELRGRLAVASRGVSFALAARRSWWLEEHRALLDAIGTRNEALAATIMRGHLRASSREVLFTLGRGDQPANTET